MLQVSWWFRPVISEPLCLPVMTLSQACWQREILWTEVKCWIATTGDGPTALTDDQLDLGFSNSPPPPHLRPPKGSLHPTRFWTKDPTWEIFFPPTRFGTGGQKDKPWRLRPSTAEDVMHHNSKILHLLIFFLLHCRVSNNQWPLGIWEETLFNNTFGKLAWQICLI